MKQRTLLKSISAPIKGRQAVALATLVGFLSTLLISLSNTTPTFAATISLAPQSSNVAINMPIDGGVATGSHNLTIQTDVDIMDYVVTVAINGNSNNMTSSNPKMPTIKALTTDKQVLDNNTWGYSLDKPDSTTKTWHGVPIAGSNQSNSSNSAIIDQADNLTTPINKTIPITYGVNIPNPIQGIYTAEVQYTATAVPKPYYQSTDGNITVEWDKHMIPIKWDSNNNVVTVSKEDITTDPHNWYNYNETNKQWANAITVSNPDNYIDKPTGTPVVDSDILGYWVYIPRYRYKVLRWTTAEPHTAPTNFTIEFQNVGDKVDVPTKAGDWATHPAFTWGNEQLSGFWIGKFETTGSTSNPTILPSERHFAGKSGAITLGSFYDVAKSLGVKDVGAGGGNTAVSDNTHHLSKASSHMLKGSEWGAVTYLSASKYGAGTSAEQDGGTTSTVKQNDVSSCGVDGNGNESCGQTGGTNYMSNVNQSTTGNINGVYDMAGGAWEYVMSGLSAIDNDSQTTTSSYITFTVEPPYVDIYPRSVFGGDYITNSNKCTWLLCGGDALYETSRVDEVTAENYNFAGWGGDGALFGYGSSPWFTRGGSYSIGYMAGLFYYGWGSSDAGENNSFRVALLTI